MRASANEITIHASCVALSPTTGLVIRGGSGSGKSALALSLMAFGASLVSDDQVIVAHDENGKTLKARAPQAIKGMIEARGFGILNAQALGSCQICALVDLDRQEEERLPPVRKERLIGIEIPMYYRVDAPHFAPSLIQMLKGGRNA